MDESRSEPTAAHSPVSVVLYAHSADSDISHAVRLAVQTLDRLDLPYEVLVVSPERPLARPSAIAHPNVRYLPCGEPAGYAAAVKLAAANARYPIIVLSNGAFDFQALSYLIPLVERYPIVWGYEINRRGSFLPSGIAWAYSALGRMLLGTRVRDCGGGTMVSLFQQRALMDVVPESAGAFAPAEMLARARQKGLAVVEAGVSCDAKAGTSAAMSWRDIFGALVAFLPYWWSRVQFPGPVPAPRRKHSWAPGIMLMALAGLLLFADLNQPLLDTDEGRQAEIPREMLAHADLLTPRMLGEPYYEKPPLQYWLTAAAYKSFGVRPWVARLVPSIAAWLTVAFTYLWGRQALGRRPALWGGIALCLSLGFITLGRTVVLDSLLAACLAGSWYAAHAAVCRSPLNWRWWLASALICGLGILAKGPVALILLVPPVVTYQTLAAGAARPRWGSAAAYLGAALAVAAPWYAVMSLREPGFLKQFLWRDHIVRFLVPFDHEQPWWFYLPVLFAATLPWSLLWPWLTYFLLSRMRRVRRLRPPTLGFCCLTAGWCMVFYSLSGCKSAPYLAPVFSPLALMVGCCLDAILFRRVGHRDVYLARARQKLPRRATLLVVGLSLGCYSMTGLFGWQSWKLTLWETGLTLLAVAAWGRWGRNARPSIAWGACAVATLPLVAVAARDLGIGFGKRHSLSAITRIARRWPGSEGYPVVSYRRTWLSALFYLRREDIRVYEEKDRDDLVSFLTNEPATLVLVESGPPLDDLLDALPSSLDPVVHLPERDGHAALVVVRQRGGASQPTHVRERLKTAVHLE